MLVVLHSLPSTNPTCQKCPSPCHPFFSPMTWWSQLLSARVWYVITSVFMTSICRIICGGWANFNIFILRYQTLRSCFPKHAAGWKYHSLSSVFEKSGVVNRKGAARAMSTTFGSILGAGVPLVYVSNAKTYFGSLRNLPLEVEVFDNLTVRYFWCSVFDLSRNTSVVPNPQLPFNTELWMTCAFRGPLAPSPCCRHLTGPIPPPCVDGKHYLFQLEQWWVSAKCFSSWRWD